MPVAKTFSIRKKSIVCGDELTLVGRIADKALKLTPIAQRREFVQFAEARGQNCTLGLGSSLFDLEHSSSLETYADFLIHKGYDSVHFEWYSNGSWTNIKREAKMG